MEEDVAAVVAHAEHYLSLGGEKAVCLGCDLDGIDRLPEGMSGVETRVVHMAEGRWACEKKTETE